MCLTEFNEKVFVDSIRAEEKISTLLSLVKKGRLSVENAAEELQIGMEEFERLLESENAIL